MNVRKAAKVVASLTLAGALFGWSSAAHATVLAFGLQETGANTSSCLNVSGTGICTVMYTGQLQGPVSWPSSGTATYGTFDNIQITAAATPPLALPDMNSAAVNFSSTAAGTINIFVTEQGITNPTGVFLSGSGFTSLSQSVGMTVTEATYVDQQDYLFSNNTLLSQRTFQGQGAAQVQAQNLTANTPDLQPVWSLTEEYTITATAPGQLAYLTIGFSDVPEPSSLVLLGSALLAMGGLLWFWRRKGAKA